MEAFNTNSLPDLSQAVVSEIELDRNEAWLKQRQGKFTSSNIHRLMGYEDKDEFPKGAMTYVEEIVIEILTDGKSRENFKSEDMERGNEKELEAVARFEEITRFTCYATGDNQEFVEMCSYFGGTPDGFFDDKVSGEKRLIEVKCPKSKTHLFYLKNLKSADDLKKHCTNYYWQIQANLYATGRDSAYFISYDERFTDLNHQMLILFIERNEADIDKLKKRLQMAENHKRNLLKF